MSFYCKIIYYSPEFDPEPQITYKAITAKSLSEAAAIIEEYFGPEIESVSFRLVDEPVINITEMDFLTCYD